MSIDLVTGLILLPFTMILGVLDSCAAIIWLAWDIAWDIVWVALTVVEYILYLAWLALVKLTLLLIKSVYNIMRIVVVPAAIQMLQWSWQALVAIVNGCRCLIQLPWTMDGFAATWRNTYRESSHSHLKRHGDYMPKEISEIVPDGLLEQLSGIISFALQFTVILIVIVSIVVFMHILKWYLEGKRGTSRSSVVMENRGNTVAPQRQPIAQLPSPNLARALRDGPQRSTLNQLTHRRSSSQTSMQQDVVNSSYRVRAVPNTMGEETAGSLTSDTELLRMQLHQANEELSLERDKSLCVVCLDGNREVLLKPCNHYCLCSSCSEGLRECPMCKKRIQKTEKIFHA